MLGVQLVTVGDKATEVAEELSSANQYQDYLYLHGFGVESAEALAEMWHKRMRQELGFGREDAPNVRKTVPPGLPRQPLQLRLPRLPEPGRPRQDRRAAASPEAIGVALSENFMLVPEQSTDALVVHHPQAKYFDVK